MENINLISNNDPQGSPSKALLMFLIGVIILLIVIAGSIAYVGISKNNELKDVISELNKKVDKIEQEKNSAEASLASMTIEFEAYKAEGQKDMAKKQSEGPMEKIITPENEISWTSGNDAKVYLKKVRVTEVSSQKQLALYFDVKTKAGGYCWQSMGSYMRITNEKNDFIDPEKVGENCINGYSTLSDQVIYFNVPASQTQFDIYNRGRNAGGDTEMVKMFSVITGNLQVKGYPQK